MNLRVDARSQITDLLLPGELVAGGFRIRRLLGLGSSGRTYEAEDTRLRRTVALKVVVAETGDPAAEVAALRREAELARRVDHPNVARVVEVTCHRRTAASGNGALPPLAILATEMLAGTSLADLLESRGPMSFDRTVVLAHDVAAGLAAIHRAGVLHLDLKSHNVVVVDAETERPRAVIVDFGSARPAGRNGARGTAAGGTWKYAAPECLEGRAPGPEADVYSFGVLLVELLTGRRLTERLTGPGWAPVSPRVWGYLSERFAPAELEVLERCLAPRPADRYADGGRLHQELLRRHPRIAAAPALEVAVTAPAEPAGRDARLAWAEGMRALEDLEVPTAVRLFTRAVESEPDSGACRSALAEALAAAAYEMRAASAAEAALAAPEGLDDRRRRATEALLARLSGKLEAAAASYRALAAEAPDDVGYASALAALLTALGRPQEALTLLDRTRSTRGEAEPLPRLELAAAAAEGAGADFRAQRRRSLALIRWARRRRLALAEAEALIQLGSAHEAFGRLGAACRWYRRAERIFEAAADRRGVSTCLLRFAYCARNRLPLGDLREMTQRAIGMADRFGDRRILAEAWNKEGALLLLTGEFPAARSSFLRALALAEEIRDYPRQASALHNLGVCSFLVGETSHARRYIHRARRRYAGLGDARGEVRSRIVGAAFDSFGHTIRRSARVAEAGLRACSTIGDAGSAALALSSLAHVAIYRGRPEEAITFASRSVVLRGKPAPGAEDTLARALLWSGRVEEARDRAASAVDLCISNAFGFSLFGCVATLSAAWTAAGQARRAVALTSEYWPHAPGRASIGDLMDLCAMRVRALLRLNDQEAVRATLGELPLTKAVRARFWLDMLLRTATLECAGTSGDFPSARRGLIAILRRATRFDLGIVRFEAMLSLARICLAAGRDTEAVRWATTVRTEALASGCGLAVLEAERLLSRGR